MTKQEAKRFEGSFIRYKNKEYLVATLSNNEMICISKEIGQPDVILKIDQVNLFEITHLPNTQ